MAKKDVTAPTASHNVSNRKGVKSAIVYRFTAKSFMATSLQIQNLGTNLIFLWSSLDWFPCEAHGGNPAAEVRGLHKLAFPR
jgi:hypothetical protein